LSGKTVGIVGLGAIGQQLARLLKGFGCWVLYAKRTPLTAAEEAALGVAYVPLTQLLKSADVVSLHCLLTPETANMIDRTALSRMERTAVLINVARGGVVPERDLVEALRGRTIPGAAMDVFETEPFPADSPLLTLDNLVVTPHLAASATETFERNVKWMFDNIARGEPLAPRDVVV
jgi:phosphoglycerate dehydrogenase-like enzyme